MQQKKLFDHPVGAEQEGLGDGQPERLRGSKVDDEIELTGLFDRKIRRLRAAQNPINITGSAPEQVGEVCSKGHQASRLDVFPKRVNRRQSSAEGKCIDTNPIRVKERVGRDIKRIRLE